MIIEVYGPGCVKCQTAKDNVLRAIKELGLRVGNEVAVTEVKDPRMMGAKGIMFTPAVVIDGVKKVEGKIPEVSEIKEWLEEGLPKG